MLNRAESASRQYRKEADAKVAAKQDIRALHTEQIKIKSKLRSHQTKQESVQQYRHEANRAAALAEKAFAEARALEKQNAELQRVAEIANQR